MKKEAKTFAPFAGVGLRVGLIALIAAAPAEPAGYWPGPMEGPVPATLAGAVVLPTAAAAKTWIATRHPLEIDVGPAPMKPPDMAATMPWLPPAHQDIPGSAWLPGAGRAVLKPDRASAYLHAVRALAGPAPGQPLLVYCHPNCWASWNAAKFLLRAGYRTVAWFPGGIESWEAAGFGLQRTHPVAY